MTHNRWITFALLFALAILSSSALTSCRKKKKKKEETTTETTGNCKLAMRLPRALITDMRAKEFQFEWLSGKINCEASDDSSRVLFDVTLRIRRDSVIWMHVTDPVIGIKVARVFITKDSVKFVQYIPEEKCFQGDFAYLSALLQTDVDFEMMQSLLVGNSVSFHEEDEKLRSSVNSNECQYSLSTVRKRKLRKVLEGQKPPGDDLQTINLDPVTFKIISILFLDNQNRSFTARYTDFSPEDSVLFPHKAEFTARGLQKSATLLLEYKKITLNKPTDFPFSIPDGCIPIIIPSNDENQVPGQR